MQKGGGVIAGFYGTIKVWLLAPHIQFWDSPLLVLGHSINIIVIIIVHMTSLTAADFGELNPPAVLTFTNTQQRTCVNVLIVDDDVVEPLETFTVTLSSTNFQVNILTRNALVNITDNDGKLIIIKITTLMLDVMMLALHAVVLAEPLFEFTQNMYIGSESVASTSPLGIPFAIRLASDSGILSQPMTVTVISDPAAGSAIGNDNGIPPWAIDIILPLAENIDYMPVGVVQLTFPAGSGPLTTFGGDIIPIEDVRVEADEIVQLTATTTGGIGSFTPNGSTTMVLIQDNDGKNYCHE
jgi:hypothetical protein